MAMWKKLFMSFLWLPNSSAMRPDSNFHAKEDTRLVNIVDIKNIVPLQAVSMKHVWSTINEEMQAFFHWYYNSHGKKLKINLNKWDKFTSTRMQLKRK